MLAWQMAVVPLLLGERAAASAALQRPDER